MPNGLTDAEDGAALSGEERRAREVARALARVEGELEDAGELLFKLGGDRGTITGSVTARELADLVAELSAAGEKARCQRAAALACPKIPPERRFNTDQHRPRLSGAPPGSLSPLCSSARRLVVCDSGPGKATWRCTQHSALLALARALSAAARPPRPPAFVFRLPGSDCCHCEMRARCVNEPPPSSHSSLRLSDSWRVPQLIVPLHVLTACLSD